MKLIKTLRGYDFYTTGVECKSSKLYNIVPHGAQAPLTGYYWAQAICAIKGFKARSEAEAKKYFDY